MSYILVMKKEYDKLTETIIIKVSPYEKNFIKGLADLYAQGNMSMYLVYAAFNSERKFIEPDDLRECNRRIRKGRTK